jgi:hypothetical protein
MPWYTSGGSGVGVGGSGMWLKGWELGTRSGSERFTQRRGGRRVTWSLTLFEMTYEMCTMLISGARAASQDLPLVSAR